MKPDMSILNPAREYTPSHLSDIRVRFAKIKAAQQAAAAPKQSEYVTTIINLFEQRRREEK